MNETQEAKIGEEMERKEASNKECEKYEMKGLKNSIGPVALDNKKLHRAMTFSIFRQLKNYPISY